MRDVDVRPYQYPKQQGSKIAHKFSRAEGLGTRLCAGCATANGRPYQLRWGDQEYGVIYMHMQIYINYMLADTLMLRW